MHRKMYTGYMRISHLTRRSEHSVCGIVGRKGSPTTKLPWT